MGFRKKLILFQPTRSRLSWTRTQRERERNKITERGSEIKCVFVRVRERERGGKHIKREGKREKVSE